MLSSRPSLTNSSSSWGEVGVPHFRLYGDHVYNVRARRTGVHDLQEHDGWAVLPKTFHADGTRLRPQLIRSWKVLRQQHL